MTEGLSADAVRAGQVIDVGGVAMHVWAADTERADAVVHTLRPARPGRGAVEVHVRFEDAAAPELDWTDVPPLEARRAGAHLTFVRGDFGLVATVTPRDIVVSGDAPDLLGAFRRLFVIAVSHCLKWHSRHVVHAAALVVDRGCILVCGSTGTGKSTAALCALRRGWSVLADDLVALQLVRGEVLATGIPRPIAAPGDLVEDGAGDKMADDWRERAELSPHAVSAGTHSVIGLVITAHARSPHGTLRRLRSLEVLPQLAGSFFAIHDADGLRTVFPLATTLSRLPAFELAYGTDASQRLDDGARLLDDVRGRVREARWVAPA